MKRAAYITISAMTIVFFIVSSALAEIDGFRGFKWGTEFSTVESQMDYVRTDPSYGGIKFYQKVGDEMKIGGAELQTLQYGFWQNKFCGVVLTFEGFSNFSAIRDAAFERFGRGHQPNRYIQRYYWLNDPGATITIDYSESSRRGRMFMSSKQISPEQKRFNQNRAKSGAESGF